MKKVTNILVLITLIISIVLTGSFALFSLIPALITVTFIPLVLFIYSLVISIITFNRIKNNVAINMTLAILNVSTLMPTLIVAGVFMFLDLSKEN